MWGNNNPYKESKTEGSQHANPNLARTDAEGNNNSYTQSKSKGGQHANPNILMTEVNVGQQPNTMGIQVPGDRQETREEVPTPKTWFDVVKVSNWTNKMERNIWVQRNSTT